MVGAVTCVGGLICRDRRWDLGVTLEKISNGLFFRMSTNDPPRSLRQAYGNALHTHYPQLDFGDTQTFVGPSRIGAVYSQPCPPCIHLAKHRVPGVEPAFEFPVTDACEIKADGTLKQAHEVARPRTRWSNARCSAKKKHGQKHAEAHELFAQDETGWKRPPPDFSAADEAEGLYASAKKVFCSGDRDVEHQLDHLARGIAECAGRMDQACMEQKAGDSVAVRHDAAVVSALAATVHDAELQTRVLCQMSAEALDEGAATNRTSILQRIIAHAEEMRSRGEDYNRLIRQGDKEDALTVKPLEPFEDGNILWFSSYDSVDSIAHSIASYELNDEDLANQVGSAIRATIPNRIKRIGHAVQQAATRFATRFENIDASARSKGKDFHQVILSMVRGVHNTPRYGCMWSDASEVARAAFPMLHGDKPYDTRCGHVPDCIVKQATTLTASGVVEAAKAIGISDDAEAKELATSLGYMGELEPIGTDEAVTMAKVQKAAKQTAKAEAVAAIFSKILLSEIESVVGEVVH